MIILKRFWKVKGCGPLPDLEEKSLEKRYRERPYEEKITQVVPARLCTNIVSEKLC